MVKSTDKNKTNLVEIKSKTKNEEVINLLSLWLEEANKGNIIGVAGLVILKGLDTEWSLSGVAVDDVPRTLGFLSLFHHDIIASIDTYTETYDIPPPTSN